MTKLRFFYFFSEKKNLEGGRERRCDAIFSSRKRRMELPPKMHNTANRSLTEDTLSIVFNGQHLMLGDIEGRLITQSTLIMAHSQGCRVCPVAFNICRLLPEKVDVMSRHSANRGPVLQLAMYDVMKNHQLRIEAKKAKVTFNREEGINRIPLFLLFKEGVFVGIFEIPQGLLNKAVEAAEKMAVIINNALSSPEMGQAVQKSDQPANDMNNTCLLTMDQAYSIDNVQFAGRR